MVLNAFRHQRKGHGSSRTAWQTAGAVLNAFRHQRKGHSRRSGGPAGESGAQRLSASTEGTQASGRPHTSRLRVLNAFRHQRKGHLRFRGIVELHAECSTPFGINGRDTIKPQSRLCNHPMCSTPFGINGRDTRIPGANTGGVMLCSTPFGINGRDTGLSACGWCGGGCAQRLSASTEGTRGPIESNGDCHRCSTPFGINGRDTSGLRTSATGSRRAQRLSASTEGTRRAVPRTAGRLNVLNAFRHQRKGHAKEAKISPFNA